jgi:hypothetical protein
MCFSIHLHDPAAGHTFGAEPESELVAATESCFVTDVDMLLQPQSPIDIPFATGVITPVHEAQRILEFLTNDNS